MSFNDVLYSIANFVAIIAIPALGAYLWKTLPILVGFMKTKKELNKNSIIKEAALDSWHAIEEDSRLGDLVISKLQAFENKMRFKVPGITDEQVLNINKAIAGQFNAGKPVIDKAISDITSEVIEPEIIIEPIKPVVETSAIKTTVEAVPIIPIIETKMYSPVNGKELIYKEI